jgi:hypothetical protein
MIDEQKIICVSYRVRLEFPFHGSFQCLFVRKPCGLKCSSTIQCKDGRRTAVAAWGAPGPSTGTFFVQPYMTTATIPQKRKPEVQDPTSERSSRGRLIISEGLLLCRFLNRIYIRLRRRFNRCPRRRFRTRRCRYAPIHL